MAVVYMQLALATLFNLGTVYCLKKSQGFTILWPTVLVIVTISITQWLVSRAMVSGMDTGLAVTTLVVAVMVGSALMGMLIFHEHLSSQKMVGFGVAIVGVVIVSLAKN